MLERLETSRHSVYRRPTYNLFFAIKVTPLVAEEISNLFDGCCQTNANPSPIFARKRVSGNKKIAPFAKGGVTSGFEVSSGVKVPFEIKMIVH